MTAGSEQKAVSSKEIEAKPMIRRIVVCLLITALLPTVLPAHGQQPAKVPRIGFLSSLSAAAVSDRVDAFRQGLRELGYVEGKNIVIEYRWAEGKTERLPDLAAELVRLKVDVIVTGGPAVNRLAKEATVTIPVVMSFDNDLLETGSRPALRDLAGTLRDCQPITQR